MYFTETNVKLSPGNSAGGRGERCKFAGTGSRSGRCTDTTVGKCAHDPSAPSKGSCRPQAAEGLCGGMGAIGDSGGRIRRGFSKNCTDSPICSAFRETLPHNPSVTLRVTAPFTGGRFWWVSTVSPLWGKFYRLRSAPYPPRRPGGGRDGSWEGRLFDSALPRRLLCLLSWQI